MEKFGPIWRVICGGNLIWFREKRAKLKSAGLSGQTSARSLCNCLGADRRVSVGAKVVIGLADVQATESGVLFAARHCHRQTLPNYATQKVAPLR